MIPVSWGGNNFGRVSPLIRVDIHRAQALPSQTSCVRFSRPSILSMMLLSSCSFFRFSNCQRLSMRRMSVTAQGSGSGQGTKMG